MTSKILVADDSITIQKIVTMAFENEDMEIQSVGNGKEAWARLDTFQPDVVLADVDMPGLSGFDLSRKIKSSAKHQTRRVILLCSDFEDFDETEFEASGADDHLSKPFKSEDIVSMVKHLLSGEVPVKTLAVVADAPPAEPDAPAATLELSADDLIGELLEEESPAAGAVVELSPEDMEPVMELTAEDMAPEEEETVTETAAESEAGVLLLTDDQLTEFDETLVPEMVEPAPAATGEAEVEIETVDESSPEFYVGERPRRPEAAEDLDAAFRSVVQARPQPEPPPEPASSHAESSKPDLIRETRVFLEQRQGAVEKPAAPARPGTGSETLEEKLGGVMSDHAVRILEAGLERNLKKELTGLTDQVRQVVRDVVREIAPEIIRSVIREEIEQIRKMEEV